MTRHELLKTIRDEKIPSSKSQMSQYPSNKSADYESTASVSCSASSLLSEHSDGMKQPESLGQSLSSSCGLWEDLCSSASLTSSPATADRMELDQMS